MRNVWEVNEPESVCGTPCPEELAEYAEVVPLTSVGDDALQLDSHEEEQLTPLGRGPGPCPTRTSVAREGLLGSMWGCDRSWSHLTV